MTLTELGIILDKKLEIKWNEDLGIFQVNFANVETKSYKDDCVLASSWGGGKTISQAKKDYALSLQNQVVVKNFWNKEKRFQFQLPPKITPR